MFLVDCLFLNLEKIYGLPQLGSHFPEALAISVGNQLCTRILFQTRLFLVPWSQGSRNVALSVSKTAAWTPVEPALLRAMLVPGCAK